MDLFSDAYPEVITKLQNENKYLKLEKEEEKEKLENMIKTLHKEIEEIIQKNVETNKELTNAKDQNKSLSLQLENCKKTR
jgi:arsenate reductase-like glutaredoxin family protein|tara:strand:- start:2 stop:241 length:240 start_codon:yes stop_codon:yes gene_type:complete